MSRPTTRTARRTGGVVATVLAAVALSVAPPASARPGPSAETGFLLPERATPFDVGGRLVLQGVPADVAGFVSPHPPAVVAAWVKARWPAVHADDAVGHRRVLGRLAGDRYLTLQVEAAAGGGTRGLWASVPVREALRAGATDDAGGWRRPVTPGSTSVLAMSSVDARVRADTLVVRNRLDVATNADHLVRRLQAEGLSLERRVPLAAAPDRRQGEWLLFAGDGHQASAVIHRDGAGETTVAIVRRDAPPQVRR